MLVSCILVSHDKPDLCHEAVQSVVNQIYQDWECIVVDSGVLYDQGYFDSFPWSADERLMVVRSTETEEIRKTKAMAPWCFNECFRNGLIKGELCFYLCDDDLLYCNSFQTFVSYAQSHPEALAMYASQDIGVIYPNGWRAIVGERRALTMAGRCCGGSQLDCVVDFLQMAHRTRVLGMIEGNDRKEWWNEGKDTETHADGVFMEKIGAVTPFYPIDIKVSQNRRTPKSTYCPSK